MTITFIGHGYVGLVTAAVFADLGNTVFVIGHTPSKIENLKKGIIPIYEPGLEELVKRNVDSGRLLFTLDYRPAIKDSSVVFIAVGTPPKPTGEADLSVVYQVAEEVGKNLEGFSVIVTKSTVPVGTNREIEKIINNVKSSKSTFSIASVPEFLREGQAISDTRNPDRVVIGSDSEEAKNVLAELHQAIDAEQVFTTIETAEMIKYASNAFLATKISFANAIAELSERVGADGPTVLQGMGLDKRIGKAFLYPGAGYGGSCFPKDVKALIAIAGQNDIDFSLLKEVEAINKRAMKNIVQKVKKLMGDDLSGKTIAVLGLAFKPNTDDMRDAPSITVIEELIRKGAKVRAFDPIAVESAKRVFNNTEDLFFAKDAFDASKNADAFVVVTEWDEFRELDLNKIKEYMKGNVLVDGRNIYDPKMVKEQGFVYVGVGR